MRIGKRQMLRGQEGFTLMIALFALTLFGLALAAFGESWSRTQQRQKEDELLRVGGTIVAAIEHYYVHSPSAAKTYPKSIEELIEDKRFAGYVHHLREAYRDPMTGRAQWGIVEAPGGGIAGVYSLSAATPLRRTAIQSSRIHLAPAGHYRDWKFTYLPDAMGNNDSESQPTSAAPAH